jgi:hypothetical protein
VKTVTPEVRACKYAEVVSDFHEAIIQKISSLHGKFDFLLLVDNQRRLLFNPQEILGFLEENKDKALIGSLLGRENDVQDGILQAQRIDPSLLLINLNLIDPEMIPEQKVGNVFFPFFSRVYYKQYKDVLLGKIPGIETQFFRVNLLI